MQIQSPDLSCLAFKVFDVQTVCVACTAQSTLTVLSRRKWQRRRAVIRVMFATVLHVVVV